MPTTGKYRIKYKRPAVFPYQRSFMGNTERFTVIEASTKIGKTAACIIWLFEQALDGRPGYNYWWVAPIYAQAKIAFARMQRQVTDPNFFKANIAELTLTLPNGAVIQFKSAEKPDSLYGEDVHAAVFDEFTRAKEQSWFALRSTLTSTGGKCKFIGNVRGRGWGYKLAQKAKNGTDKEYSYRKITCWDAVMTGKLSPIQVIENRHLIVSITDDKRTRERREKVFDELLAFAYSSANQTFKSKARLSLTEVLQSKRDLPDHVFAELYEAEPSDDGGNPFGVQHLDAASVPVLSVMPDACIGIDLAKSVDFTAFVGLDDNLNVCRLTRFQLDWTLTKETIKSLPDVPIHIDATGVGNPIVEESQKTRTNMEGFIFTKSSKQPLIEALVVAIRTGKITFPAGTPLADELYSFEYVHTSTGVRYSAPEGLHDDCVMAYALAYNAYRKQPIAPKHSVSTPAARKGKF